MGGRNTYMRNVKYVSAKGLTTVQHVRIRISNVYADDTQFLGQHMKYGIWSHKYNFVVDRSGFREYLTLTETQHSLVKKFIVFTLERPKPLPHRYTNISTTNDANHLISNNTLNNHIA